MKKQTNYSNDLAEIRQLMERSTKFLSLSGWSGVIAGIFALLGVAAAMLYMKGGQVYYDEHFRMIKGERTLSPALFLAIDAVVVLVMALSFATWLSARKAKRNGEKFWSPVLKRLLFSLAVPLVTGGLLSIILVWKNNINLVAPMTLVFYGLALVNAGKYTNREIIVLGLGEIAAGLAAAIWQDYGLWFWALGFGIFHIIYGITLYLKYERS